MKGSALAVVSVLMSAVVMASAVTNIQRCLGSKNEWLCMSCCGRLSSEKPECEQKCPGITQASQMLLTCTRNPSTCYTCCFTALSVLSYRPDLMRSCTTSCRSAMALGLLG